MNNLEKEIDEGLKELVAKVKKRKIMAKEKEKNVGTNDLEELTPQELEILNLQTQLKDLKDLYDNEVRVNRELTNDNNELQAKTIELQSLLIDSKLENDGDVDDFKEEIIDLEKDLAIGQAINEQLEEQIQSYLGIIEKLIEA